MDKIIILDTHERIVVSRIPPECKTKCFETATQIMEKCSGSLCGGTRRKTRQPINGGTIFLCTDDADLVASKRRFQDHVQILGEMLKAFQDLKEEATKRVQTENRRLVHNLTTLNSHILQEIYSITPQEHLSGGPEEQINAIKSELIRYPARAAASALRILKNAVAARSEMQIVRRLQPEEKTVPLNPKSHAIHRVVKNALITFFQDSQERGLVWRLGNCTKTLFFDYETVSVALYRLFENAVKYCKPSSEIYVSFHPDSTGLSLILEMKSLWISFDEAPQIFEEGVSGSLAIKSKLSGDGLGLYFVREMLNMNNAFIHWEPMNPENSRIEEYGQNRFVIRFRDEISQ